MTCTQNNTFICMRFLSCIVFPIFCIFQLTSCAQLPQLFGDLKDIETQEAVRVIIDKEAITKKDVDLSLKLEEKK